MKSVFMYMSISNSLKYVKKIVKNGAKTRLGVFFASFLNTINFNQDKFI